MVLFAPRPDGPVASIFDSTGTTLLYAGFLAMGLSQGLVEGVINPLVATIFNEDKTHKLNVLHAWWPGGMIVGGLTALALTAAGASWQVKLASIIVPAVVYLAMILGQQYPRTERVASNVSTGEMFRQAANPLFLLLFVCMWLTAATELGPDQWFPSIMKELTGLQGVWFLIYTAGLMFVLRFFFGGIAHRISPFAVLAVCSVLSFLGLYWLGGLQAGTSPAVALVAATLFGVGKTYYWPTMLGVTSELFPKGGALLLALMGGAGMLCIALVLPIMGARVRRGRCGSRAARGRRAARDPDLRVRRALRLLPREGRLSRGEARGIHDDLTRLNVKIQDLTPSYGRRPSGRKSSLALSTAWSTGVPAFQRGIGCLPGS